MPRYRVPYTGKQATFEQMKRRGWGLEGEPSVKIIPGCPKEFHTNVEALP